MHARKRFLCLLFAALLLASLVPVRTDAAESVCFTAVNDQLLPLSDDTMPFWSGGQLYLPSSSLNGTTLGLYCSYNHTSMTAVVIKGRSALTFDLSTGSVTDNNDQVYSGRAVQRSGQVFLPLGLLCRFFGLDYSYTHISYGYLLRVRDSSVVLSDERFIDAAGLSMAQRYARYEREKEAAGTDTTGGGQTTPGTAQPAPETPAVARTVYLAFEATAEDRAGAALAALSESSACVLLTPEHIPEMGGLLRRLAAGGGVPALRIDASAGAEDALERIEAGNRAFWAAASAKTRFVRLDNADGETERAVEEAGYCLLRYTVDYGAGLPAVPRMTARIFSAADANRGSCFVFLGADEAASGSLGALSAALRAGSCTIARINETLL